MTPLFAAGFGASYSDQQRLSRQLRARRGHEPGRRGADARRRRAARGDAADAGAAQALYIERHAQRHLGAEFADAAVRRRSGSDGVLQRQHRHDGRVLERPASRARHGARRQRHAGGSVRGDAGRASRRSERRSSRPTSRRPAAACRRRPRSCSCEGYHGAVAPFCSLAARSFFSQF